MEYILCPVQNWVPPADVNRIRALQGEAELHEPIHNLCFRKPLVLLLLLSDVIREVAMLTEFHDDDENALLDEGVLVGHDVRVIKLPKQISLEKAKEYMSIK